MNLIFKIYTVLGYVGGSDYKNPGAAVEPLCLPKNPQWGKFKDGKDGQKAELLGAEYQMHTVSNYWRHYHDHDVLTQTNTPCSSTSYIFFTNVKII